MPAISKIRLTNVVYEGGDKRFNDEVFHFDGHNAAVLLENGGGKTVYIHTVLQAVLPHTNLGDRKIKETLQLENAPAHIGIEWMISERPRRYMTTVVSLFLYNNKLDSYRYVFEYDHDNPDRLEKIPFVRETSGGKRPAYKEEMAEYFSAMKQKSYAAQTFDTIGKFHDYIEDKYQIIKNEWESIVKINRDEGGIEKFFENCRTTTDLFDRLLIPTVEDSIAGHDTGMFADMFEEQREGFKQYRDLQKSMEEHQAIQEELKKYVTEFEDYSKRETAYEKLKQQAKGLSETIREERGQVELELQENEVDWENWRTAEALFKRQQASYQILQEQAEEKELETAYLEKEAAAEEAREVLRQNEQTFHNLTYAKFKQELQATKQLYDQYQLELEEHDAESDVADLEADLERENAKLHGYYLTTLEALDKTMANFEIEKRPLVEIIEQLTEKRKEVGQQLSTEKDVYHQTIGQLSSKQEEMERLKQSVLANPDQENVHEQLEKWHERQQYLDDAMIDAGQQKKSIQKEIATAENEREAKRTTLNQILMDIREQQRTAEDIQIAHDQVVEKLATLRVTWKATEDLHLKEGSIRGPLEDMEQRLTRERETLMLKERLALRFVDDYGEQDIFFADAFLQERINDWQNQLYIELGPVFLENMSEEEKQSYEAYPLWPLTLVTTEADKAKLTEKMMDVQDRLQFPISIMTLEEAKQIGERELDATWISPEHWQMNLDEVAFSQWKETLEKTADEATALRKDKEDELDHFRTVQVAFEQFFVTYPLEKKEEIQAQLHTLFSEKDSVERTIATLDTKVTELKRVVEKIEERLENDREEYEGLSRKLENAARYVQVEHESIGLEKKKSDAEQKMNLLENDLTKLKFELERYEADQEEIDSQFAETRIQLEVVKQDDLFLKVKQFKAVFTNEAKKVIEERRETLQDQIRGIQRQYGEIRAKYDYAKKEMERIDSEMESLVEMHQAIDTEMDFPVDGESLLSRVREKVQSGKDAAEQFTKAAAKAKEKFDSQTGRLGSIIERFEESFPEQEIFTFDMDVEEIKPFLQTTKQHLAERKTYVTAETKRIETTLKSIANAAQELEKYEIAHYFNSSIVTAISLTEKEITEYTYGRKKFVQAMTSELTTKQSELLNAKERIDEVKRRFRAFCRNQITEPKLREMAMNGIETKNTYEDVLAYQQNMLNAVERADRIARDFISKQDREVQAFINHMYNHLLNVTEQLRAIPKNTRVKVGEKWKEIFKFTIPEWTEDDGKSRLRNHMDWILEQLDSDFYKTEQGLEDHTKVRKEIETWLHTKQLLQVVMDNKGMKASCRKVTNDNQVSSRLTSWEQSNQWSGGEKWSKNMTLFLGILNFVAEKKQHIKMNTERHRAVILDNPFGKASSDHVLNPVFFIAEQLGFQIIALTAHADGKFLQDYFPIIYSLKLRPTHDESKQIMTKEKSLHHAYFQEHDPVGMDRLEEREQLELF